MRQRLERLAAGCVISLILFYFVLLFVTKLIFPKVLAHDHDRLTAGVFP